MKNTDDKIWSAYLDGELSVTEIEKMEAELTPAQLDHLQKEKALEIKMADQLNSGVECPDEVWQKICSKVEKENSKPRLILYWSLAMAAAAALAVFFLVDFKDYGPSVPLTIKELKEMSQTSADLDGINEYLSKKQISLQLLELPKGHHTKTIIGAGVEEVAGQKIVTLLFNCCGRPVKIYVLPKNSAAEQMVLDQDSAWKDGIRATGRAGDYRLAVVSRHGGVDILSAITAA